MKISKGIIVPLAVIIILLLIGVGIWVGVTIITGKSSAATALSPYSAVYLSTGDIYFGKLDWSPTPHMEDTWFLQRSTNPQGDATVGVYPFSQVAWGPSDTVYFNTQQIIFWTRLNSTSSIAQLIANPAAASTAEQDAAATQVAGAPSVSATTSSLPTVSK